MRDETTVSYIMDGFMRVNDKYSMPVRVCLGHTPDEAAESLSGRFSSDVWLVESVTRVTKTVRREEISLDFLEHEC